MTFKEGLQNLRSEVSSLKSSVSKHASSFKESASKIFSKGDEGFNTLRSSDVGSIAAPRTSGLGTSSTTSELLKSGAIPGQEGVILSQRVVKYSDIWQMSEKTGLEFALTRENGNFILRSGAPNQVNIPVGVRPIAHTHPSNLLGKIQPIQSIQDINSLNAYWKSNPNAPRPKSIVIWGESAKERTIFGATGFERLSKPKEK
jgi:hypothetical protein